jgi:hypothetical protein
MVNICQMFWVEFKGESCRLRPIDSGVVGTGIVRACVRWPCSVVSRLPKYTSQGAGSTFALQRSRERDDPAQFRTSVAKRLGSGFS